MNFHLAVLISFMLGLLSCAHTETNLRDPAQTADRIELPFLPGKTSPLKPKPGSNLKQPPAAAFAPHMIGPSLESLTSEMDFDSAATLSEGFIKGAVVKFLIDNRSQPAKVYFINGNYLDEKGERPEYVQYHYYFAQKQLGINLNSDEFNRHTYFTNDLKQKKFIAGTLQKYHILSEGQPNIFYGIQFYPQDYISDESILHAARAVKSALNFEEAVIKVVSSGSQQKIDSVKNQLQDLNIGWSSSTVSKAKN